MRKPRKIDFDRLTELWNREPHLTLAKIAELMSTPELRMSSQQVSSYAHRYGLKKRKEYNTRQPGGPRKRKQDWREPVMLSQVRVRCPRCSAQVSHKEVEKHTCPDSRIVARAIHSYSGPLPPIDAVA